MGELLEIAKKQHVAVDMVVEEQKGKLAEAEGRLLKAEKEVVFLRNVVNKAVEVAIDMDSVVSWLYDQEG